MCISSAVFRPIEDVDCTADPHTGTRPAADRGGVREHDRQSVNPTGAPQDAEATKRPRQPGWAVDHNISILGFAPCEAESRIYQRCFLGFYPFSLTGPYLHRRR